MSRRIAAVMLLVAGLAASAAGDTFLLEGGARVTGEKVEEYTGRGKRRWVRVRTPFGHVNFAKGELKKHMKAGRPSSTLRVAQIVVTTLVGDVWKSADGKAWIRISPRKNDAKTWAELPINTPNRYVAPGERIRTGKDGEADLDLGFGVAHVRPGSDLVFAKQGSSSMKVLTGEGALRLDDVPKRKEFVVETPQGAMGVRGTTFLVRVGETARLAVDDGSVQFADVTVRAGEAAERGGDERPEMVERDEEDERTFERLRRTYSIPRIEWVHVPGGSYEMGLNPDETPQQRSAQAPRHTVTLPDFRIGKYEVTNAQFKVWLAWLRDHEDHYFCYPGEAPGAAHTAWEHTELRWTLHPEFMPRDDEQAVGGMDWSTAYGFCAWIGARLPSEAEWEYAARAGDTTGFPYGNSQSAAAEFEWIGVNSGDKEVDPAGLRKKLQARLGGLEGTHELYRQQLANRNRVHPPGRLEPNALGVHDMLGNVGEWCMDLYHPNYDGAPTDGRAWVREDNLSRWGSAQRVMRGRDYVSEWGNSMRASWRSPIPTLIGIRPARTLR